MEISSVRLDFPALTDIISVGDGNYPGLEETTMTTTTKHDDEEVVCILKTRGKPDRVVTMMLPKQRSYLTTKGE